MIAGSGCRWLIEGNITLSLSPPQKYGMSDRCAADNDARPLRSALSDSGLQRWILGKLHGHDSGEPRIYVDIRQIVISEPRSIS